MRNATWLDDFYKWKSRIKGHKFIWGYLDCVLFSLHCIKNISDIDYYSQHFGKYDSQLSAYRYLNTIADGIEDAFDKHFPDTTTVPYSINIGDPILIEHNDTPIMGVQSDQGIMVITTEAGVVEISEQQKKDLGIEIKKGWRI